MSRFNKLIICLGVAMLVAGCAKTETELRAEAEKKANAEINFRNVVGLMEYCSGKGYLDRKLVPKLRADFDSDFDRDILKAADLAYRQGRKGTLLLRMNPKADTDAQTSEGGGEDQTQSASDDQKIDVTFTQTEDRNGELSVFCKRTELWAAREVAAGRKYSDEAGRKGDD